MSSEKQLRVGELSMEHSNISEAYGQVSEVTQTNLVDIKGQTQPSEGINRRRNLSECHQSMYRACLEGDCEAAEMLMEGYPNLSSDEISEGGDRALHVAVAMKHGELVQKLVKRMSRSDLALVDGHGYTACCYAAISGSVEIAGFMMRKNPTLATARDKGQHNTPLQKAANLRGNSDMVLYFLKSAAPKDLSTEEWFGLLLEVIRRGKYDAALEILGINEQLATKSNDQGTALHLLAGQHFHKTRWQRMRGVMAEEMRLVAEKLWAGIQRLGQSGAVELLKTPHPILHNAAKVGNIELITMLTRTYPDLVWLTDNKGYTIFHVAVIFRQEGLFQLIIDEIGVRKDVIAVWKDAHGNNILHLVGDSPDVNRRILLMPAFEMQREMLWFKKVQDVVPPSCLDMKNNEKKTPLEMFYSRHNHLLEESRNWLKNVSDFCMLIATIIFTVVFGSAFAVPGGFHDDTGMPNLLGKSRWFTIFVVFEALAMLSSACSMLCFLRIMLVGMKKNMYLMRVANLFAWGVNALSLSILAAASFFLSAYFMVFVGKLDAPATLLVAILIVLVYAVIVSAVCYQIYFVHLSLPIHRFRKHTQHSLFKLPADVVVPTKKRRFSIF